MHRPRRRGACLQCARKKRKCDHKHPRCTQCVKHGQICEPQTFKVSTPSIFNARQTGNCPSPLSQLLQHELQTPAPETLPENPAIQGFLTATPTLHNPPDASTEQDLLIATPGLRDEPNCPIIPDLSNSVIFETFPGVSGSESSSDRHSPRSPDTPSGIALAAGSLQTPFTGFHIHQGTQETIDESVSLGIFPQDNDDTVTEIVPQRELISSAAHLSGGIGDMSTVAFLEPFPPFVLDRLYCPMPWPDDMLVSPERRFLWQYFLSIAEADFLCLDWEDVGHLYGFQHPYITTLPHMALSNEALRSAIFCFAASQYQLRNSRPDFEQTKGLTGSEAALALSNQMARTSDDNGLLSMISAATLLHYFGPQRHDYLHIASRLVSLFLARSQSRPNAHTSFPEVPLTEFRWSVISTLCSLQQPSTPLGDQICRLIEMSEDEIKQKYSRAFQRWVSHPIYTFSPRLVNPLLRIGRLLERQLLQLSDPDVQPDLTWTTQVAEAEEMLLAARESDVNASKSALGSADPAAVLALNESMYAAGAILLYARIHGLPPTAPFIRRQTRIVTDEILKIPFASRVSFAIVFPLFIAGCEAIEQQMRDTIIERLRDPKGITYDRGDLVGALNHIWDIRDLDPGLPWPHWVNKVEPRYRISCLM